MYVLDLCNVHLLSTLFVRMREGTCAGKEKISEPVVAWIRWIYPSTTRISMDITLIFSTTPDCLLPSTVDWQSVRYKCYLELLDSMAHFKVVVRGTEKT